MSQDVKYVTVDQYSVAVGQTLALFIGTTTCEVNKWVLYSAGGTALMLSAPNGTTAAASLLATLQPFALPTSQPPFDLKGSACFYFAAAGTTSTITVIRGYNGIPYVG